MSISLYELSEEEAALIEGLRQGQVTLDKKRWIEVTNKEREVVELIRLGEYGEIVIRFVEGEPQLTRLSVDFLHGNISQRDYPALVMALNDLE